MDNESDIIEFDYNTNEYIQDFMWADGKSWDRICNRLNELYEENEQLKYTVSAYMVDLNNYKGKCSRLEEKNELLEKKLKCITESLQNELNASLR